MNKGVSILVVGLGIATATVATLAVQLWPELGRQRAANAALLARVEALESSPRAPGAVPETASPAVASSAPPVAATAAASAPVVQPAPPPPAAQETKPPMAGMLEAMQSPEGRDLTRNMMRSVMSQMYPDIATELDLTAEETGRLFDLLVKQQEELSADSMGLLTGGGNPAAMQDIQRRIVEKERAHEQELSAMLGSKYAKWEQYQSTAAARQQVSQLRTTLAASGNPLSEAQEKSLVAAFAREQGRIEREEREWMRSSAALSSPNMLQESVKRQVDGMRRQVELAAPILDASQLSQFRRQVDQQASMVGAMLGMMGGQGAAP